MRLGIISALAFFLLRKMVSLNSEAVRDPHPKSFNFCFVISECGIKLSTILSFFSNSRPLKLILNARLLDSQVHIWLPYDLAEVIKLIEEIFQPKTIFFSKKYFMSFFPYYCHYFHIIVFPSEYCHSF